MVITKNKRKLKLQWVSVSLDLLSRQKSHMKKSWYSEVLLYIFEEM